MNRAETETTLEHILDEIRQRAAPSCGHPIHVSGVAMAFEHPEDFDLPLEKILAALGSGLISVHTKGAHPSAIIAPPRK